MQVQSLSLNVKQALVQFSEVNKRRGSSSISSDVTGRGVLNDVITLLSPIRISEIAGSLDLLSTVACHPVDRARGRVALRGTDSLDVLLLVHDLVA